MFKNIVVAMSGGVDSAVAAFLLKGKGYNVIAAFMKNWDIIDETGVCSAEKEYEDAKKVCKKLNIPLYQVNFVKEYWNDVFNHTLEKYQAGCTPNPDILCNKFIKFDKFFHYARTKFHADAIATGHYVKTSFGPYLEYFKPDSDVRMLKAIDSTKDQTFFLCQVPQRSLRYCMFPLGKYFKSEVKTIARMAGLNAVLNKKESMGICFIGLRKFQDFINGYVENKCGNIVELNTNKIIGRHEGIHNLTIGQRCKIPGSTDGYFVVDKNVEDNIITVVHGTNHPALYTDLLLAHKLHWISKEVPEANMQVFDCDFRFQHRYPFIACKVFNTVNDHLIIQLSRPLRAITKGQYAVLYSDDVCLGGAEILSPGPSYFSLDKVVNVSCEHENTDHDIAIQI